MTESEQGLERLEAQLADVLAGMGGLESVASSFRRELESVGGTMRDAGQEATGMSRALSTSLGRAFEGLLFDGKRASEVLAGLGRSISSSVLNQALAPVEKSIGSAIAGGVQSLIGGLSPFAKGAVFSSGRVAAFARGGVVDGPTYFPMRGGTGLMGEAGPEAVMPLARGADGQLGVKAGGGGSSVHVTMNVTTPDVGAFQKSQSQIAAEMMRALQRGRRNM